MTRFKQGQEVVCIDNTQFCACHTHPKVNEIVVVDYYDFTGRMISLTNPLYSHSFYCDSSFEELPSMEEINEALEVLTEKV
jgi:hypothetical protein